MDKPSSFRQLKIYYYRYKDTQYFAYGLVGIIVLVCIIQVIFVIFPVWNQLSAVRVEEDAVLKNISIMEANSDYLASINPAVQSTEKNTVLSALPITKDYAGVYNAIISGASRTGIVLSGFSYDVGSLDPSLNDGSVAQMTVGLNVNGSIQAVTAFVEALRELLPLSDVQNYSGDGSTSSVSIAFFYGGEQLPIPIKNTDPLTPLSQEKKELLNTLSSYQPPSDPIISVTDTSSASAFSQPPF